MKCEKFLQNCKLMFDKERIEAYQKGIVKFVLRGDTVLICGTQGGLFALLAAAEGASKVIAYEADALNYKLVCKTIQKSEFKNIEVVHGDGTTHPDRANVVILNSVDTMLVSTDIIKIANALVKKKIIYKDNFVIPKKITTFYQPIFYDFNFNGHDIFMPLMPHDNNRIIEYYSNYQQCHECKLHFTNASHIKYDGSYPVINSGTMNAIRFHTITHITDNILIGKSPLSNNSLIVPTEEKEMKEGNIEKLKLSYYLNSNFSKISINI